MKEAMDRVLRRPVESGAIAGVVALAADDRGVIYQGAFGKRAVDRPEPMTVDSVFRIASMTKAITSAAAMQLVEQGRIGLDQPMNEVVPEIGEAQILEGFDENSAPRLRKPKSAITLRHLLTHTSGYSYDFFNADVARYFQHAGLPSIATCKNESLKAPILFDPGEGWEYGIGIDWAGKIVEAVSGQKLEDYLQQNMFRPLGMSDTSFLVRPHMADRLVGSHARTPDGKLTPIQFDFASDGDFHMGGGGLYSTGPDYLSFTRMILGGGRLGDAQVLKPETVSLMGQNHIGDIDVPMLRSADPAIALEVEMFPGQVKKWGLSFLINTEDTEGGRAAGSLTWAGVQNTHFWIDPKRRIAAVLLTQLLPFADPAVLETLGAFEQAVYAQLVSA